MDKLLHKNGLYQEHMFQLDSIEDKFLKMILHKWKDQRDKLLME